MTTMISKTIAEDRQRRRGEETGDDRREQPAGGCLHRRQDLQSRVEHRLRQIERLLALGGDGDRRDAERRFLRFHALEQVLDGGFDEKLGLDAEPAADFLPQIDAESLQLAALFEHEGPDHARGHAHAGRRSLGQTSRRSRRNNAPAKRPMVRRLWGSMVMITVFVSIVTSGIHRNAPAQLTHKRASTGQPTLDHVLSPTLHLIRDVEPRWGSPIRTPGGDLGRSTATEVSRQNLRLPGWDRARISYGAAAQIQRLPDNPDPDRLLGRLQSRSSRHRDSARWITESDGTVGITATSFGPGDTVYLSVATDGFGSGTLSVRWTYAGRVVDEPKKRCRTGCGGHRVPPAERRSVKTFQRDVGGYLNVTSVGTVTFRLATPYAEDRAPCRMGIWRSVRSAARKR